MWLYVLLGKYGKLYPITYEPIKNPEYELGYKTAFDSVYVNIQEREVKKIQIQLERNDVFFYFPESNRQLIFDRDQIQVIDLLPCNI